jgi:Ca-activated chloride channel homolog
MRELFGVMSKNNHPIPLLGVRVEGQLLGRGAKLTMQQRFRNEENNPIEALYKFPLPENSAVTGYTIWVGEKEIKGIVEERDKAFGEYDTAMINGDGAYLLDEERPNIFTLSVGNLNPGMEVIVEITLVFLIDSEGSKYRLTLPTTISPRYVPPAMPDEDGIPITDIIHPPYAPDVPYGLSLLFQIHHSGKLASVESPSHPIKVNLQEDLIQVELTKDDVRMDRDFILLIDPGQTAAGKAYRYDEGAYAYWQLDLALPESDFETKSRAKEIIFLLDCSGSMGGTSIREAKKALEICLKALQPGCTFDVYRFGSRFNSFFDEPQTYSEYSLNKALQFLKHTDADLGGTEIFAPLQQIFSGAKTNDERVIVLLTDGQVANEQQVFELTGANRTNLRFFAIGIGAGPNNHLIKGLAKNGNGAAEFIYPGERIEPKMLRMFSRINSAKMEIKSISWHGEGIEQAPLLPVIFPDTVTTIFARSKAPDSMPKELTVKGSMDGTSKEWKFAVQKAAPQNMPLPRLWARERIRELEEADQSSGSQQVRKAAIKRNLIIDISKNYQIMSRYTSFLGIEKRSEEDKSKGAAELRKIPALVTTGWHGLMYSHDLAIYNSVEKKSSHVRRCIAMPQQPPAVYSGYEHSMPDILMDLLSAQQSRRRIPH